MKPGLTLELRRLLRSRQEATVAANAGSFPVPLGGPLRPVFPSEAPRPRRRRQKRLAGAGGRLARALRVLGLPADE